MATAESTVALCGPNDSPKPTSLFPSPPHLSLLPLPPPPPPPESAALQAALEHLRSFTRCDRCNRPFSSSSSAASVVQITSDCDHLFCLECDASSLAECPVCRVPTLPRKHMVHLTQVSAMLDLISGLQKELQGVGLLEKESGSGVEAAVETFTDTVSPEGNVEKTKENESEFDAALRQCKEPDESTTRACKTTASVLRASQTNKSQRGKRRISSFAVKTQKDDVKLPSPKTSATGKKFSDSSPSTATRKGRWSSAGASSVEKSPKGSKSTTKEKADHTMSNPNAAGTPSSSTSRAHSSSAFRPSTSLLSTSPSPATAQRLFSARRKREIVKAKKKEVNENGETPLHVAARRGQKDKVEELLKRGSQTNTKDFAGLSPLFDACGRGFEDVVKILLNAGAHPNTPCGKDNDTPLHEAAFHGNIMILESLLNHGANPRLENIKGKTSLDMARQDNVKIFLSKRSSVTARKSGSFTDSEKEAGGGGVAPNPTAPTDQSAYLGSPLSKQKSLPTIRKLRSEFKAPEPSLSLLDVASHSAVNTSFNSVVLLTTGLDVDDAVTSKLLFDFVAEFDAKLVESYDVPIENCSSTSASSTSYRVTHVICGAVNSEGNVERTSKYLSGVVAGLKMVTTHWLSASLRQRRLQPEELFLVCGSTKNPLCEGPKKSLLSHFYNFPPLFAGYHFYLDAGNNNNAGKEVFENPNERDLARMIEIAGGMILSRKPAWFDGGRGGCGSGPLSVPFHAQKCVVAKNVAYFVISEGDGRSRRSADGDEDKENLDTDLTRFKNADRSIPKSVGQELKVSKACPNLGRATKSWLLNCFDRFEIIDAENFEEGDVENNEKTSGKPDRNGVQVSEKSLEALRDLQAKRISRSRDDGSEYLMAL